MRPKAFINSEPSAILAAAENAEPSELVTQATQRWRGHMRKGAVLALGFLLCGSLALLPAHSSDACTDGETQACPTQSGVCEGSQQVCAGGEWSACDAPGYQSLETLCDGLDNDCDGRVDKVDLDGDDYNACWRAGVENELLITGLNGDGGTITILEYRNGAYEESWSVETIDVVSTESGGEAGDLTGDGVPEFVLSRQISSRGRSRIEVWSYEESTGGWYRLSDGPESAQPFYIGDIADFDNDGLNEVLVTEGTYILGDNGPEVLNLFSWDGRGLAIESTLRLCERAKYFATAGDFDGDGTPEIAFQCFAPYDIVIQEFDGNGYPIVGAVTPPQPGSGYSGYEDVMTIDDIEAGDVNGDGRADAVFCGNSGQGHVLTYQNGSYFVDYTSPSPIGDAFSQTCSVGDLTNDGALDFLVVNDEGPKVFSYSTSGYGEIWSGPPYGMPPVGGSVVGDCDNDGNGEFLFSDYSPGHLVVYESDVVDATSFTNTHNFENWNGGKHTIIVANLNPSNDEPHIDCDDTDPARGSGDHCGPDYSRPAAGSGAGHEGMWWSDEFTMCNTSDEARELLFKFTERGDDQVHTRAETIAGDACTTFTNPVMEWFGEEMYGAFLIDVMNGPAIDIRMSGVFKGEKEDAVMGQFFGNVSLEDAVTGDAYIFTTSDPAASRSGTGFQVAQGGADLAITLENPIGTVHWNEGFSNLALGGNDLFSKIEQHAPGVPNLVIHYKVQEGAVVPFGSVTDNASGDPTTHMAATPGSYLVMPVIGKTPGAAGVDWQSEFMLANLLQQDETVTLNLYTDQVLTGEVALGPGEVLGYGDLVGQITWSDAEGEAVTLDQAVGGLEIIAEHDVIAGGRFYSVNRETGTVMGQSMQAFAEPNLLPDEEYLFLGVQNEDTTGVVRARLGFTNLTEQEATLKIDVLMQDGTLAGSFQRSAEPKQFSDWRIPEDLTEEGETYTLLVTTTQEGYGYLSQGNRDNDFSTNYPLARHE